MTIRYRQDRAAASLADNAASAVPGKRPDAGRERVAVPVFDGFRGLAVLWIVLGHIWWLPGGRSVLDEGVVRAVIYQATIGLDVLFIVSGFVMFLPAALSGGDLGPRRSYARRRIARIVPAYYLSLILVVGFHRWIATIPATMPWESLAGFGSLVSHLLFLQTYTQPVPTLGFGANAVIWTLTLEATFYVLLPFVAKAFHRRPVVWLLGVLAVSELWQWFLTNRQWWGGPGSELNSTQASLVLSLPTYMGHFALGMACALLFVRVRESVAVSPLRRYLPLVQAAAGTVLVGLFFKRTAQALAMEVTTLEVRANTGWIALLLCALMMAAALGPRWAQWPFANRAVRSLGDISYGIYLSHLPLIGLAMTTLGFRDDGTNAAFLRMVAFVVPSTLLLGWASHRFIEQPARRWARRPVPAVGVGRDKVVGRRDRPRVAGRSRSGGVSDRRGRRVLPGEPLPAGALGAGEATLGASQAGQPD
jgi:peptidoglycan/LPS O-acetylase OafA/YrhL